MAKYKITIDREVCFGDKLCVDLAPETFKLDEDDKIVVIDAAGNWPEYILKAAMECPNDAVILHDAETGEKVWPR